MSTKTSTKPEDTAKAAAETIDALISAGKEAAEAAYKAGTDATNEAYQTAVKLGEKQIESSTASYKKAAEFGADGLATVDAITEALTKGFEAFGAQVTSYAKTATTENLALMTKMSQAKTPADFATLQADAAIKAADRMAVQSAALGKIAAETFVQTSKPVKSRIDETVEAFSKFYAA